jgi:hypothetical protein
MMDICSRAATEARGIPRPMPAHREGSNIHAGIMAVESPATRQTNTTSPPDLSSRY